MTEQPTYNSYQVATIVQGYDQALTDINNQLLNLAASTVNISAHFNRQLSVIGKAVEQAQETLADKLEADVRNQLNRYMLTDKELRDKLAVLPYHILAALRVRGIDC